MENLNDQESAQIYQSRDRIPETPPPTYEESQDVASSFAAQHLEQTQPPYFAPPNDNNASLVSTHSFISKEQLAVNLPPDEQFGYRLFMVSLISKAPDNTK